MDKDEQFEQFARSAEGMIHLVNGQLTEEDFLLFQAYFNTLLDIAQALFKEQHTPPIEYEEEIT